jgi:SAM-dependent methyltransferase
MKEWKQLESIVVCPFTHESLRPRSDSAVGGESGHSYQYINGVPVLRHGPAVEIKDPNHVSNPLNPAIKEMMLACPGNVLFLGAGASDFRGDRIFELEYNLFKNTDVVGDAHCLPFRDGVFDLVIAMNVFEHLREPHVASAELHRVMAPGGRVMIHTAFLQILHEEPHHYYGATEFGVRQWFRDFQQVQVNVSGNFNPFFGMSWMVNDLLHYVGAQIGEEERTALGNVTLAELATGWRSPKLHETTAFKVLSRLPKETQARFASGFEVLAVK